MEHLPGRGNGRLAQAERRAAGREVRVVIDLDGSGSYGGGAVVPQLDAMLGACARHACFDLAVECVADPVFEQPALARLVGECTGAALAAALFDRQRVNRLGAQVAPLEDALVRVVVDLTGRPHLVWRVPRLRADGVDPLALFRFIQGLVAGGGMTLHVDLLAQGRTAHVFQAVYRALGAALRQATWERPHGPPPVDPAGGI